MKDDYITLDDSINSAIMTATGASGVWINNTLQELWSGYGSIMQLQLAGASTQTAILKLIEPPAEQSSHPRGWNTSASHQRKLHSYQIESRWYEQYAKRCNVRCKIPAVLMVGTDGPRQWILMEDLTAEYPLRAGELSLMEVEVCLRWLANFHAEFLNDAPQDLWPIGTYWHLDTRMDELANMPDGPLKERAADLNQRLNESQFQCLVHGDAKLANFCFGHDMKSVAAVDFQYVGGGVGIKDVVYFLGSALSEDALERHEAALLDVYFQELHKVVSTKLGQKKARQVVEEWSALYAIAWTDFYRFLQGWMPSHQKINNYTKQLAIRAFDQLEANR